MLLTLGAAVGFARSAQAADWYVAPGGSGDGTSSDNAAPLVSTVLANEALADNDIIHVAAGDYEETARLEVTNAISIIGEGYKTTTITQTTVNQGAIALRKTGSLCQGISFLSTAAHTSTGSSAVVLDAGTLVACRIANWKTFRGLNLQNAQGGAIADRCIIEGNGVLSTSFDGGGATMMNGAILRNSLIRNNNAGKGGGVCMNGNGKLLNCTIIGNTTYNQAGYVGGGVYVGYVNNQYSTIANCIVRGNSSPADSSDYAPELYFKGGQTTKNCLLGTTKKLPATCFTGDPCYASEVMGFYYILDGSAAQDTGCANYATDEGDCDLAGNARKVGDAYDVGCYEYDPGKLMCWFSSDVTEGHTARGFTFTSGVSGATGEATYDWEFLNETTGNKVTTNDVANPVFSPTEMGYYSVSLVMTAGGQTASYYMGTYLDVRSPVCYVDANATNPVYPYDTPETATTDLAAAYEACGAGGGEVIINSKLSYAAAKSFTFNRGVIVRGKTADAADTTIEMGWNNVRFDLNHAEGVIRDLTFSGGGQSYSGHGVVKIGSKGGLVSNCRFVNSHTTEGPGAAYLTGGRMTGCLVHGIGSCKGTAALEVNGNSAIVDYCVFSNTSVGRDWAYGLVSMNAGTLSDCVITNNTSSRGTVEILGNNVVVRNNTIMNNRVNAQASYGGGGIYWEQKTGARVVNNIVVGNVKNGTTTAQDFYKSGSTQDAAIPTVFSNNASISATLATNGVLVASANDLLLNNLVPTRESPLVDAGTDAQGVSERDLAGELRVMGNAVDIGAYEYNPMECDFTANMTSGTTNAVFQLEGQLYGSTAEASYDWTVTNDETGDEVAVEDVQNPSFKLPANGTYSVRLVATSGKYVLEKVRAAYLSVFDFTATFVADKTDGYVNATNQFTSTVTGYTSDNAYAWTFTNETTHNETTSDEANPAFVPAEPGIYSVTLTVTHGDETASYEKANYLTIKGLTCSFTSSVTNALQNTTYHFVAKVDGAEGDVTYTWTFKNNFTGDSKTLYGAEVDYEGEQIGQITVTLSVSDGKTSATTKVENFITVQPSKCYANPKSENAAFPYDSWDNAASNVYDAVSTCGEGGEVVLASETFVLTNTVYLKKPITVHGTGAREDTILKIKPANTYIVSVQNDQATLKNVTLTGANAGYLGKGGLSLSAGVVTNCVIRDNVANGTYAGPAAAVLSGGRLTGSLICNNKGGHARASAMEVYGDVNKVAAGKGPIIDHCAIVSNSVASSGNSCEGVMVFGMGVMHDCLIAGNSCSAGTTAGVNISSYGTMYNCTITGNKSGGAAAGGLYWNNQPLARIVNCAIVGNENLNGNEIAKASNAKDSELKNSFLNCVLAATNVVWGTNCKVAGTEIYNDYGNGDFTLASGSVARDMGLTSWKAINNKVTVTITGDDVDHVGKARIQGDTVDAGAYEYDPYVLACSFAAVGKTADFVGATFCLTGIVSGASGAVNYAWTVSRGDTTNNYSGLTPSFTLTEAGYYDVKLVATAPNGTVSSSSPNFLHAVPREFNVTPGGMTFEQAVEQSIDGCTINVAGANEVNSQVYVNNAVTIVGVQGASLYGQAPKDGIGSHGIVYLNNAQAVLRGVTVSKGGTGNQYGAGGGIYISSKGGIVEDCIVENNGLAHYGCGAGIYVAEGATSAVIRRTIIRNNKTTSGYSGAGVYLGAGVLENCLVSGNYGSAFGGAVAIGSENAKVRNCTIVKHDASPLCFRTTSVDGGSPEVVNTIIADNSALDANTNRYYMSWCYGTVKDMLAMDATATNNIAAAVKNCAFDQNKVLPGMANVLVMASTNMGFKVDKETGAIKSTYELSKKTPLRDKGLYQSWMQGETDLYGMPRCDWATYPDIGCSEAQRIYGFSIIIK